MWSKEECAEFFKKTLGLEFTDSELNEVWSHLNQNQITPVSKYGGNIVAFTPLMLQNFINLSLERTGLTLKDRRYKKVSEEIMPALAFTLLLKKLGLGEFLIVSSDVPDIALVDFKKDSQEKKGPRASATPLEAIYLPQQLINEATGNTFAEKVAGIVIDKKFGKSYVEATTLLITINAEINGLSLNDLSNIFSKHSQNKFHQIWIFIGLGEDKCVIARISPDYVKYELSIKNDLFPLYY